VCLATEGSHKQGSLACPSTPGHFGQELLVVLEIMLDPQALQGIEVLLSVSCESCQAVSCDILIKAVVSSSLAPPTSA
jgi:hypothetical protein